MMQPDKLSRVAVVGISCCGKTTFARRLSQRTGMPHVELDALYWGPEWMPRSPGVFQSAVQRAITEPHWICDGNYSQVRDRIWRRATTVVWLDLPLAVVFGRSLWRTLRRCVGGEAVCGGNRESLRNALSWDSVPMWVLRTNGRRRREYPRLLAEPRYGHLEAIRLRTAQQVEQFLEAIAPVGPAGCAVQAAAD